MTNLTTNHATSLQAKVLSINTLHEYTKIIVEHETKGLNYLIGTNPLKVDGTFKAKIKHDKLNIESHKINKFGFEWFIDIQYYFECKYNYFTVNIRTCVNGGGGDQNNVSRHCIYENQKVDLFKIDSEGNFCENDRPIDFNNFKSDYNETELLSIKKEIHEAAENYKQIVKKAPYIFNHVLNIERLTR